MGKKRFIETKYAKSNIRKHFEWLIFFQFRIDFIILFKWKSTENYALLCFMRCVCKQLSTDKTSSLKEKNKNVLDCFWKVFKLYEKGKKILKVSEFFSELLILIS